MDFEDSLEHQKKYTEHFYYNPDELSLPERKFATKDQLLGLQGELAEFQDAIKVLPWKSGQESIDYNNVKEELIDVYHFFMNLCILWGIKDEDTLKRLYFKKNEINYKRGKVHQKPNTNFEV